MDVTAEGEDDSDSFMWKHMKREHNELLGEGSFDPRESFRFKLTGSYRDPLTRQLTEMIRIRMANNRGFIVGEKGVKYRQIIGCCMNFKEENFAPYICGDRKRFRRRK